MLYLIICDINEMLNDYIPLYDEVKGLSKDIRNPMKNVWFVNTDRWNAEDIYKKIDFHMYFGDQCLVMGFDGNEACEYAGDVDNDFLKWFAHGIGISNNCRVKIEKREEAMVK